MNSLTVAHFERWLEAYGRASAQNDPAASAALFAENAEYYETPFADPLVGREAIYQYWRLGALNLTEKESAYEILTVQARRGLARWRAAFTVVGTGQRIALDCVFLVEFDEAGACRVFREWWHRREFKAAQAGPRPAQG